MTELLQNIEALVKTISAGKQQKYLFFWGHQTNHSDRVGKECLSQWYPANFESDGHDYLSAEHFMMAEKARLFEDEETREKIIASTSSGAAKALGRQVKNFSEQIWLENRFETVVQANVLKFEQNAALKAFLLSTGEKVLVEASPVDRIWGIGMAENDPHADNPRLWNGLNLLGFALMKARHHLQQS